MDFAKRLVDQRLVLEHFRHECTKSSDVRMSTRTIFDPNAFPRLPIDRDLWNSKLVIQFYGKETTNIHCKHP